MIFKSRQDFEIQAAVFPKLGTRLGRSFGTCRSYQIGSGEYLQPLQMQLSRFCWGRKTEVKLRFQILRLHRSIGKVIWLFVLRCCRFAKFGTQRIWPYLKSIIPIIHPMIMMPNWNKATYTIYLERRVMSSMETGGISVYVYMYICTYLLIHM